MFKFLNFLPRVRNTDPITSAQAADAAIDLAKDHAAKILAVLKEHGPLGKDGIAFILCMEGAQISRRLSELEKINLIQPTGKKVMSMHGRAEREWMIK